VAKKIQKSDSGSVLQSFVDGNVNPNCAAMSENWENRSSNKKVQREHQSPFRETLTIS
jgi:hypothetical protein